MASDAGVVGADVEGALGNMPGASIGRIAPDSGRGVGMAGCRGGDCVAGLGDGGAANNEGVTGSCFATGAGEGAVIGVAAGDGTGSGVAVAAVVAAVDSAALGVAGGACTAAGAGVTAGCTVTFGAVAMVGAGAGLTGMPTPGVDDGGLPAGAAAGFCGVAGAAAAVSDLSA